MNTSCICQCFWSCPAGDCRFFFCWQSSKMEITCRFLSYRFKISLSTQRFYLSKFVQSWKEMLFHVSVWFYFRIILSISRHMDVLNGSLILFHVMFYSGLSWISEKTARTLLSIICTFRARRFSLHAQTSSFMRFSLCDDFHYANNNSNYQSHSRSSEHQVFIDGYHLRLFATSCM